MNSQSSKHPKWKIALVIIALTFTVGTTMLFILYKPLQNYTAKVASEQNPYDIEFILIFGTVGSLMVCLGLPSTIFEILIGFIYKHFIEGFLFNLCCLTIYVSITYLLAVKCLRNNIYSVFKDYKYYNALEFYVQEGKWINIFFIRILNIPMFTKNLLIPILNPNVY